MPYEAVTVYQKNTHPVHWLFHFMYAAEIIGYCHPDVEERKYWQRVYSTVCDSLHVNPETSEDMEDRLSVTMYQET